MSKIMITCDSTADLTKELYEQFEATVVPMGVNLGDEFRRDGLNITISDIFEYVAASGQLPKTSAVSVGEYDDVFRPLVEQGYEVIHVSLSSSLSSSHQNACLAAEELGSVYVVDSKSLSTGIGHLVLLGRELAASGMSAAEVAAALEQLREKLDVSFVLQTLEYLHKGGRCSGVAAFGANLMKLRPEIEVVDGKMQVGRKYRGNMEKTVLSYIRGRLEGREDVCTDRIFITHSGVDQAIIDSVKAELKKTKKFDESFITRASCTISSHCGPGCLGILFMTK